jgi:hypothetical protein
MLLFLSLPTTTNSFHQVLHLEVLAPANVRETMKEKIRAMAERYKNNTYIHNQ